MKVRFEIDVPDDTTWVDVQMLLTEFHWLVRARGWRAMLALPKRKSKPATKPGVVHDTVQ
jgi:hypothetical protein